MDKNVVKLLSIVLAASLLLCSCGKGNGQAGNDVANASSAATNSAPDKASESDVKPEASTSAYTGERFEAQYPYDYWMRDGKLRFVDWTGFYGFGWYADIGEVRASTKAVEEKAGTYGEHSVLEVSLDCASKGQICRVIFRDTLGYDGIVIEYYGNPDSVAWEESEEGIRIPVTVVVSMNILMYVMEDRPEAVEACTQYLSTLDGVDCYTFIGS